MPFLTPQQRSFLTAVSQLVYANPFLPERVEFERAALGDAFVAGEPVWSQHVHDPEQLQARLGEGGEARPADLVLYEDAVLHLLYQRYFRHFFAAAFGPATAQRDPARWRFYNNFLADWRRFFQIDGVRCPTGHDPRHTFACFRPGSLPVVPPAIQAPPPPNAFRGKLGRVVRHPDLDHRSVQRDVIGPVRNGLAFAEVREVGYRHFVGRSLG